MQKITPLKNNTYPPPKKNHLQNLSAEKFDTLLEGLQN